MTPSRVVPIPDHTPDWQQKMTRLVDRHFRRPAAMSAAWIWSSSLAEMCGIFDRCAA
jgi:hypothetical protein